MKACMVSVLAVHPSLPTFVHIVALASFSSEHPWLHLFFALTLFVPCSQPYVGILFCFFFKKKNHAGIIYRIAYKDKKKVAWAG